MRTIKTILFIAAFTLAAYAGVTAWRFVMTKSAGPSTGFFRPSTPSRLVMSMEGFTFAQYESGTVPWRMTARHADLFENKEAGLRDVEVRFLGSETRTVTLLGEKGTLHTATGNATLRRGNRDVRLITSDGYLLTTASLVWQSADRLVRTPDPFKLLGGGIYLEGTGLSADTAMQQIEVKQHVKAVLQE